ncbi:MAG: class I SAM-dependent methyltransferase [Clostridiales bacterium]|nr:class I SAM-dependent methyltransferase [Clostridiales bacterium]
MKRLRALCALVDPCESFIDVGCDHGYAVQYVYQHRLAKRITACDISAPSLEKAKRLLDGKEGITFVCADGAAVARGHETVLISGMGGKEMCAVMAACSPKTFVLSPQSHAYDVRVALSRSGYEIVHDEVIFDHKFYDTIKAVKGAPKTLSEPELLYGAFVRTKKNDMLVDKLRRALAKAKQFPSTAQNEAKRKTIEEVLLWQLR